MTKAIQTACCISGGGPAGLMLGLLLARSGVDVTVLEKHEDFLRDFRGDTIHPSTMQSLDEIGLLDRFLTLPHQAVPGLSGQFGTEFIQLADFSRLKVRAPYIAMMPQWEFLNFLASHAAEYPNFRLLMDTEAKELLLDGGKICGLRAESPEGEIEIRAKLTVAADGRGSTLRDSAGLSLIDLGAPIDVLWFRLSRQAGDSNQAQAKFEAGRICIALNRGDYWQCAYVIPKGANDKTRSAGMATFRAGVAQSLPFGTARADEIQSWEQVKLLTVQVNRLKQWWKPGFLCIGDAAHAMSPVGGVGVNLAVQDAIATANVLAGVLQRDETLTDQHLMSIQKRREWPTRVTQQLQLVIQNYILSAALTSTVQMRPPLLLKLITSTPWLRRLPSRILGLGVRPEHVATSHQR